MTLTCTKREPPEHSLTTLLKAKFTLICFQIEWMPFNA